MKLWAWLLLVTSPLLSQNPRTAGGQYARQALTYEEFDAYAAVVEAPDPQRQLKAAESFKQLYPDSELLVFVYEHEVDALRGLKRLAAAKASAEQALKLTPNNTKVMLALAQLLADDPDPPDEVRSSEVQQLVARCLEELGRLKTPRTVSPKKWEETRSKLESDAHAANGLMAARSGRTAFAIREFEAAVALNSSPDGAQHFYLGHLYAVAGRIKEARAMLAVAEKLGPERVRKLAVAAISKLP